MDNPGPRPSPAVMEACASVHVEGMFISLLYAMLPTWSCVRRPRLFRVSGFIVADGLAHQLGCATEIELFFYARAVSLDGLDADPQRLRYPASVDFLAKEVKDGEFTVGELLDGRESGERFAFYELRCDELLHSLAEIELARQNCPNCLDHPLGRLAFHDVALGASPKGAFGVMEFFVHRENQHQETWIGLLQVFDQLDAG